MSETGGGGQGARRAKWTGAENEWVQYRLEDGTVGNLPAADLSEREWEALPVEGKRAARESGLYAVQTEKELAERRKPAPAPTKEP